MTQHRDLTEIVYTRQFEDSARDCELPPGFVRFHKANFAKTLGLNEAEFSGKSALDTGSGPGKHAAVLALMGARVTAVDLIDANISAMRALAAAHAFPHFDVVQHDLMHRLPESLNNRFDIVTAHNWVQHTEDPSRVIRNLAAALRPGGLLYLSVYQAGTFRFFTAQLARKVLRWNDRERLLELAGSAFPEGFAEFDNPDDISLENMLDDYFVPFLWTFQSQTLHAFLEGIGCDLVRPHVNRRPLYAIDNEPLRVGCRLRQPSETPQSCRCEHNEFAFEQPEMPAPDYACIRESGQWAERAIASFNATPDESYARAAFCLGLYRLRARWSRSEDLQGRHNALRGYLQRAVSRDLASIHGYHASKAYYRRNENS